MARRFRRVCVTLVLVGLLATGCGQGATSPRVAGTAPGWFGPGVGADALANTRIGGPFGTTLAFRFRPTWSGNVTGVRFYIVVNSGSVGEYSGGNGGTLRVSLVAGGKGGLPTTNVLASAELRPQISAISFPLVRFGGRAEVTAGRDYDIVFTNTSAKPAENWISVNALVGHGTGTPQPPLALAGGVFLGDSADGGATPKNWRARAQGSRDSYLPIMEIAGGRTGQHLGLGYMESWISNPKPIDRSAAVRELFTYKAARAAHVLQAFVRVRRTGAHVGPLSVQLEDPGGGTLAAATIPGLRVPSGSAGWVSATFRKPPLIRDGSKLALVLRSTTGAFEAFPLRKGLAFNDSGIAMPPPCGSNGSGFDVFSPPVTVTPLIEIVGSDGAFSVPSVNTGPPPRMIVPVAPAPITLMLFAIWIPPANVPDPILTVSPSAEASTAAWIVA